MIKCEMPIIEGDKFEQKSSFLFDFDKKEISCQCYTNCAGITPTKAIVEESFSSVVELIEHFGDMLVDLAEGNEPSEEVFEELEELYKTY